MKQPNDIDSNIDIVILFNEKTLEGLVEIRFMGMPARMGLKDAKALGQLLIDTVDQATLEETIMKYFTSKDATMDEIKEVIGGMREIRKRHDPRIQSGVVPESPSQIIT